MLLIYKESLNNKQQPAGIHVATRHFKIPKLNEITISTISNNQQESVLLQDITNFIKFQNYKANTISSLSLLLIRKKISQQ